MNGANIQNRGSSIFHKIKDFDEIGKIVITAAEPQVRGFAGGFPHDRRPRNAFELIQDYSTKYLYFIKSTTLAIARVVDSYPNPYLLRRRA